MIIHELHKKKNALLTSNPVIEPLDIKKELLRSEIGEIFGEDVINELE